VEHVPLKCGKVVSVRSGGACKEGERLQCFGVSYVELLETHH